MWFIPPRPAQHLDPLLFDELRRKATELLRSRSVPPASWLHNARVRAQLSHLPFVDSANSQSTSNGLTAAEAATAPSAEVETQLLSGYWSAHGRCALQLAEALLAAGERPERVEVVLRRVGPDATAQLAVGWGGARAWPGQDLAGA
jgi:hypothetical protein